MKGPFAFISPCTWTRLRVESAQREPCAFTTVFNGAVPARQIARPCYSKRIRMCTDGSHSDGGGIGHVSFGDAGIGHSELGHTSAGTAAGHADVGHSGAKLENGSSSDSGPSMGESLPHEIRAGDDGTDGRLQGPTPAPTQAGVSTFGLGEEEAKFMEACYEPNVSGIEGALDAGVDVHTCDVNKRTAMHFCAGSGLTLMVRRLAELGADLNVQDMLGLTPLHMATGYKKPDTVKALVDLGADPHLQCYGGELPVELGERLLRTTPRKRLFVNNPDYVKLTTIVELLDSVTEEEEGDEEEDEVGDSSGSKAVEEVLKDGTKLTIRRKPKAAASAPAQQPANAAVTAESVPSDVNVTVRRKESTNSSSSPERRSAEGDQDASFTIRRRGGGQK